MCSFQSLFPLYSPVQFFVERSLLHSHDDCIYCVLKKKAFTLLSHQSPKQSHAEDHTEQIEATSRDHRWRTGRLQSRKEHHRADLQPANPVGEISPAPARPLPFLNRPQEGLRQCLACSFVGDHKEVQYQHQPFPSNRKPLWQNHKCSPLQQ